MPSSPITHEIRTRARKALQDGEFDWAEQLLALGHTSLTELTENLRIYQAELELQNTELREAQEQTHQLASRYNTLFANIPMAVLVIDRHGLVLDANAEASRLFGLMAGHLRNHFLHRLVARGSEPVLADAMTLARRAGSVEGIELLFRGAGTDAFSGELHIARLPGGHRDDCQLICAVSDVSERVLREAELRQAHARLMESESRFHHLSDLMSDIAYSGVRHAGRGWVLDWVSGAVESITGHAPDTIMARHGWREFIVAEDRPRFDACVLDLAAGETSNCQLRLLRADGSTAWLEATATCVREADGGRRLYGGLVDISARKQAEDALRQTARAFESAAEGVIITDAQSIIRSVNPAFTEITGYAPDEVLGQNPRLLQSGRHDAAFYRAMWASLLEQGRWQGEIWDRRRDGEHYPAWLTIANVTDDEGHTTHYVAVFSDISILKRSQEQLAYLAHHDPLTQLPNRILLQDRLEQAIRRARREREGLAILFVDLDRFKLVNDTLGHAVGDDLLRSAARRMIEQLRASDTLARVGGDEFVVLLEHADSARRAATVAAKLLDTCVRPHRVQDHELVVTASIGVSFYPHDGEDPDTLLRHADLAMYKAKSSGRNAFQCFQAEMDADAVEHLMLGNALRGALARGELHLHYQPQVDLATGALVAVEALARWRHPERGPVAPGVFIPLAEEMGLIGEIGTWVMRTACQQMRGWVDQGLNIPRIAVNLSMQQLERDALVRIVDEILRETGLPPNRLELEVTESMLMRQAEHAIATLKGLRLLGVGITVDDFGTGYSSLGYIRHMPLDRLKIDYSFVRDIGQDRDDEIIVRAIIGLGRSLDLEVVAEGVEHPAQASFLAREGCRIGQGYLYGRPMDGQALAAQWSPRDSRPAGTLG